MENKKHMVIFQPSARRGEIEEGTNVLDASRQLGVDIEALCGEKKVCGKCKVRIEEGFFEKFGITSRRTHVSGWQEEEDKFLTAAQKEEGYRLACVATIQGPILVFVPEEARAGKQIVSKAARDIHIDLNPAVKTYYVQVTPPTFEEPTGDFERICAELQRSYGLDSQLAIDWYTLRKLPRRLREGNWSVTLAVWMEKEVVRVLPGKVEDYYGIAIDVGTTTVAAYLCNMRTMEVITTASMMNPQCKYGEDVMARITYHMMNPKGLETMSNDLIAGLNKLVAEACQSTHPPKKKKKKKAEGATEEEAHAEESEEIEELEDGMVMKEKDVYLRLEPNDIVDMTLVGNTAMHHILLQLDPEFVGLAPFPPVVHRSLDLRARDLGIKINDSAYVHVLPNEAGFVGADNVGVLIAEEPYKHDQMQLIIDIGTNGELVLGNKKKLISCSCATGPALEGAQLSFGMRAAPGAIERIRIDPDTLEVDYKVIGRDAWRNYSKPEEMKTKGICGSGILDVLAELYTAGVIGKSGRFNKKLKTNRYRVNPDTKQPEFVIAWANETSIGKDVVISQKDVRQIQLGKGALYTGCKLMMRRMGLEKVDAIKIAGAFGTHVDKTKALIMGLFPDCELDSVFAVGNAAGDGARAALLNREKRAEANWVSRNVEYIELTVEEDFQQQFMEAMQVPHMKDEFSHLEGIVAPEVLHQ